MFTVSATEPWRALAGVALGGVSAGPTMSAGLILTSLGRSFTMRTMPAFGTLTVVAECSRVLAGSAVLTWVVGAVIKFPFAVRSCKPRRATASVRTLSGVKASAAMPAWFVIGAVIQILVAKQASPSFITEAVPRLLARTVEATRVPLTLVTQATFPSTVAQAFVGLVAVSMLFVTSRQTAWFRAVISLPT